MKRHAKAICSIIILAAVIFLPLASMAGDLEPAAAPASTMHTLDEIYSQNQQILDVLNSNSTTTTTVSGSTLADAPVEKTGQTTSYTAGDDGDHEAGMFWPVPRFTDNGDGTIRDNLTGLIWLKNANCFGTRSWTTAINDCNTLNSGECGLTDGSVEGDWRLANVKEIQSIIDYGNCDLALPSGHPFLNVQFGRYWSSTTCALNIEGAWVVGMNGGVVYENKALLQYVWPVRSND